MDFSEPQRKAEGRIAAAFDQRRKVFDPSPALIISNPHSIAPLKFSDVINGGKSKVYILKQSWPLNQRKLTVLPGNLTMMFARGTRDDYCIYIADHYKKMVIPQDRFYFKYLQEVQNKHQNYQLYEDFIKIYDRTTNKFDANILPYIANLLEKYVEDTNLKCTYAASYKDCLPCLYTVLSVMYAGMVAEENKDIKLESTPEERQKAKSCNPLGKRVKRLGMYQILVEGMSPEEAANFSKKPKDWAGERRWCEHLDDVMRKYGF